MTGNTVADDRKNRIPPTDEQIAAYFRREQELRARFLKGVLDFGALMMGLQQFAEMTGGCINCNAQPEIPDWTDETTPIIHHIAAGMIDPAGLTLVDVLERWESCIAGDLFLARAQKARSLNACAFDFYARPENWKYLPQDADVIVFAGTVFRGHGGLHFVRCLCRNGAEWGRDYRWLYSDFDHCCRVAVSASPLVPAS